MYDESIKTWSNLYFTLPSLKITPYITTSSYQLLTSLVMVKGAVDELRDEGLYFKR